MSYMSLSSQEKPLLQKKFLDCTCFSLFVLSRASDNTTSQKYLGDECMGRLPTSNFGGDCPLSLFAIKCDGLCIWNDLRTDSRNISNIVLFQKTILAGLNYQNKIVL